MKRVEAMAEETRGKVYIYIHIPSKQSPSSESVPTYCIVVEYFVKQSLLQAQNYGEAS